MDGFVGRSCRRGVRLGDFGERVWAFFSCVCVGIFNCVCERVVQRGQGAKKPRVHKRVTSQAAQALA